MSNADFRMRTNADLLPTDHLANKWVVLLTETRQEHDPVERAGKFNFAHGWLRGLVDAGVLSNADMPELRELLIAAKPQG